MNSRRTLFLIVLATLAAVGLFAGCSVLKQMGGFKKPTMRFKSMALKDASFSHLDLDFEFEVDNPNGVGLTLGSLDYQLDIDGSPLLQGDEKRTAKLAARAKSPLHVPLTVDFKKLGTAVGNLFAANEQVPYRLQAGFGLKTPIGVIRIPLDVSGNVPLSKLPKVSFGGVALKRMSLTGAQMAITMNVANPSKFPLRIDGAKYAVSVAGTTVTAGEAAVPSVAAGERAAVEVPINLNFLKLGSSAVRVIKGRRLPYDVQGTIDLGLFSRPFQFKGEAPF